MACTPRSPPATASACRRCGAASRPRRPTTTCRLSRFSRTAGSDDTRRGAMTCWLRRRTMLTVLQEGPTAESGQLLGVMTLCKLLHVRSVMFIARLQYDSAPCPQPQLCHAPMRQCLHARLLNRLNASTMFANLICCAPSELLVTREGDKFPTTCPLPRPHVAQSRLTETVCDLPAT